MTDWIKHDSTNPPALAPAALVEIMEPLTEYVVVRWASDPLVRSGLPFRPVTDPEGIPYCSAEVLAEDTKYVATNEDGVAMQYTNKPFLHAFFGWMLDANTLSEYAPDTHRHPGDWKDSLMRVWRER